ncbi:MAG: ectoine/hydroxyectoine ABC transporter permease subunit EhuD [Actinomycetota bacterium]|nr:ectoine/hydroxyectoine ABC transporter permease subunit EhuD [Actinomycetota bacterium]
MTIWDNAYALDSLPKLLAAFFQATLVLTVLGTIIGASLGLVFALIRWTKVPVLSQLTWAFIEFVRSTPVVIQLFFLFYALPDYGVLLSPMQAAAIGLGVHYACYYAEVYRAGILAVPAGQWEASTAVHLSRSRTWQRVILPQAIRNVLPSLGNYAIALFKETPFAALITVLELVRQAREIGSITGEYLEPFTVAGLIFLAASYTTALGVRRLERRLEASPR